MADLDRIINWTCPDGCGQIATGCSLRMILNNEPFFCEACGTEFQAPEYPGWLESASFIGADPAEAAAMAAVYSFFYNGGPPPSEEVTGQLLESDPGLWRLFPIDSLPVSSIAKLLENEEFAAGFDLSSLKGRRITELLALRPDYVEKADPSRFTAEDWLDLIIAQPRFAEKCPWEGIYPEILRRSTLPVISREHSDRIFQYFPWKNDERFRKSSFSGPSVPGGNFPGESSHFLAVVNYLGFFHHIDWKKFEVPGLLAAAKRYHRILQSYPFRRYGLQKYGWSALSPEDWEKISSEFTVPEILAPICSVSLGKNVAASLKVYPWLIELCRLEQLSSRELADLLITFPRRREYWKNCDWRKLQEADWNRIMANGRNSFAAAVRHVMSGEQTPRLLKRYPELNALTAWEKIPASDWFALFRNDLSLARHCHWGRIYGYIRDLAPGKKESIRKVDRKLWKNRAELFSHVDVPGLRSLPAEQYIAVWDFFDWEEYFDFSSLTGAQRLEVFKKHPQLCDQYGFDNLTSREKVILACSSRAFGERWGWKRFTPDEAYDILRECPGYFSYFESRSDTRKILRQLADTHDEIAEKYKLNVFDYLFFRKFNALRLSTKITFLWHLLISLALFAGAGWQMYTAPDGFRLFFAEMPFQTVGAVGVYLLLAVFWSIFHARLYAGRTPFLLTAAAALSGSALAVLQFKTTFFLTELSLANYISWGVLALLMLILRGVKKSEGQLFKTNRSGMTGLLLLYLPAALLTLFLCQTYFRHDFPRLSGKLEKPMSYFSCVEKVYRADMGRFEK